jgi:hypothetical protein
MPGIMRKPIHFERTENSGWGIVFDHRVRHVGIVTSGHAVTGKPPRYSTCSRPQTVSPGANTNRPAPVQYNLEGMKLSD